MRVTVMGHAGLYVEAGQERILIDPILRTTPIASGAVVHAVGRVLALERMPPPTLLVITHAHLDHFDPESLKLLPRDVPLVVPEDGTLLAQLRQLGFGRAVVLRAWERHPGGGADIVATPSGTDIDEFGLLIESAGRRFWHMSDAEATVADGARIGERGQTSLVSVKYQPTAQVQGQVFRNLGATFDKGPVIEWLEAACAARPRLAFPYASGIAFQGVHAWNNSYAFPFTTEEIVALLNLRLAADGGGAVAPVAGDVIELRDEPRLLPQASPFIKRGEGDEPAWEPFDASTLAGVASREERVELERRLDALLPRLFRSWLDMEGGGPLGYFIEYGVVWQLTVHLGGGDRLHYAVDFGASQRSLSFEPHPRANFFAHIGGASLLRVLRGEAGAELFHACGDLRLYEKILFVRDGAFRAPPAQGWELYDQLPEPLTWYLRHPTRWQLQPD